MIDTEQRIEVAVDIDRVWDYVKDMQRWAELMPGMREFTVIDDDNSRWVLKVGVGGLVPGRLFFFFLDIILTYTRKCNKKQNKMWST